MLSGADFVTRDGLRSQDAISAYGLSETLYSRWKRSGKPGVFTHIKKDEDAGDAKPNTAMIDATYLKAYDTASSVRVRKGIAAA